MKVIVVCLSLIHIWERSREPEAVLREFESLVRQGYKDITLLGQNVNSYGNDLGGKCDFPDLLRKINDIPGDFWVRFMTSHPKDATKKLFDTMAECEKVCGSIHLPVQAAVSYTHLWSGFWSWLKITGRS